MPEPDVSAMPMGQPDGSWEDCGVSTRRAVVLHFTYHQVGLRSDAGMHRARLRLPPENLHQVNTVVHRLGDKHPDRSCFCDDCTADDCAGVFGG